MWDMVPYDVQLIGGIVLHQGRIAEMATGEGKTLVATLPLYLNALAGRGAHLVTVNYYLARRDSQWMGHVYKYLGLTVGCLDDTEPGSPERRAAYLADITYGTNNEFGFDYLRDNMVFSLEQRVQREHVYAIVDEVDSILIDEARTPLIISGPGRATRATTKYAAVQPPGRASWCGKQTERREHARRRGRAAARATTRPGRTRALKLYQAQLGMPEEQAAAQAAATRPGVKQLVQQMELEHIADRKLPIEAAAYARPRGGRSTSCSTRRATRCTSPTAASTAMSPNDPDAVRGAGHLARRSTASTTIPS